MKRSARDTDLKRRLRDQEVIIDAALTAWRASLSPEQIAERELSGRRYLARLEYMQDALRQFGLKGDLMNPRSCMPVFVEAWRRLGLPPGLFQRSTPRELFQLIEDRINFLQRLEHRPEPSPDWDTFFKRIAGRQGGHRKSDLRLLNTPALEQLRRGKDLTKCAFARLCGLSRETYYKAEVKGIATDDTVAKICKRGITRETLLKKPA